MKLPQFTLRDLFWLVLVCALAVGWWVSSRRQQQAPQVAPAPPVQAGRWQIVIDKDAKKTLIDTATGDTWSWESYQWFPNARKAPEK